MTYGAAVAKEAAGTQDKRSSAASRCCCSQRPVAAASQRPQRTAHARLHTRPGSTAAVSALARFTACRALSAGTRYRKEKRANGLLFLLNVVTFCSAAVAAGQAALARTHSAMGDNMLTLSSGPTRIDRRTAQHLRKMLQKEKGEQVWGGHDAHEGRGLVDISACCRCC